MTATIEVVDSATPDSIPVGRFQAAAVYIDGLYKWSAEQISRYQYITTITVQGSKADWGDVENGALTVPQAIGAYNHGTIRGIYGALSSIQAAQQAGYTGPVWTANPTQVQHLLTGNTGTQWGWFLHYDESTFLASWFDILPPPPPVSSKELPEMFVAVTTDPSGNTHQILCGPPGPGSVIIVQTPANGTAYNTALGQTGPLQSLTWSQVTSHNGGTAPQ